MRVGCARAARTLSGGKNITGCDIARSPSWNLEPLFDEDEVLDTHPVSG